MTHFNAHNRKYVPGKVLTKDFRELIVHKLETQGGDSITGTVPYGCYSLTAKTFSVSEGFVCKIWKLHCTGSGLSPTSKGPVKGANRKLSHEDEECIQLLVTSNPTIYWSEVHDLLVQHSNAINDINNISLSTIQRTICNHLGDETIWTRKKTSHSNDLRWTPENIIYTQQFLNTIQLLNPDDLVFMDESSVHINCGGRMYGSSKKGDHALHFSKHLTGANYTLHLITGLHGKIYYEVTTGASNSMTFINFMYNATNSVLEDGCPLLSSRMHVIVDNASMHKTYSENVVHQHLDMLGIGYHFLPTYSCNLNPVETVFLKLKTMLCSKQYSELLAYDVPTAILHAMEEISSSDMFNIFHNVTNNYMNL